MPEPIFAPPPGFTEAPDQPAAAGLTPGQTATVPTGTPEVPESSPLMFQAPPGFSEAPKPEEGYLKQVGSRISTMAKEMYDAWDKGDFPRMTGVPQGIEAINKQYYETPGSPNRRQNSCSISFPFSALFSTRPLGNMELEGREPARRCSPPI